MRKVLFFLLIILATASVITIIIMIRRRYFLWKEEKLKQQQRLQHNASESGSNLTQIFNSNQYNWSQSEWSIEPPPIEPSYPSQIFYPTEMNGLLVLRLAVFVDHLLYDRFQQILPRSQRDEVDAELQKYVFTVVQHTDHIMRKLRPPIAIELVKYHVFKYNTIELAHREHRGDMENYLKSFSSYQAQFNSYTDWKWHHATMLTGHDLSQHNQSKFSGYTTMHSICDPATSCSLVEGSHFRSAFTLAHELGHTLNMHHDGAGNDCPSNCCVMSSVVESGRNTWSNCSIQNLRQFIASNFHLKGHFCLNTSVHHGPAIDFAADGLLPGQRYSLDDQCRMYFGKCWRQYESPMIRHHNICSKIKCSKRGKKITSTHIALDGTNCGVGKWCMDGKCLHHHRDLSVVDGEWSVWQTDSETCYDCSRCYIDGQYKLRRLYRTCSDPMPQNGGAACRGPRSRPVFCSTTPCVGESVAEYAGGICRKVKVSLPAHRKVKQFDGTGLQRFDGGSNPCIIWCGLITGPRNVFTFNDSFPDGTPCGTNRICVSSECQVLTIDYLPLEAPTVQPTIRIPVHSVWNAWTQCSATCGLGSRIRYRTCTSDDVRLRDPNVDASCALEGIQKSIKICYSRTCSGAARPDGIPTTTTLVPQDLRNSHVTSRPHTNGIQQDQPIRMSARTSDTAALQSRNVRRQPSIYIDRFTARMSGMGHISVSTQSSILSSTRTAIEEHATARSGTELQLNPQSIALKVSKKLLHSTWSQWSAWSACKGTCSKSYMVTRRRCQLPDGFCEGHNRRRRRCRKEGC